MFNFHWRYLWFFFIKKLLKRDNFFHKYINFKKLRWVVHSALPPCLWPWKGKSFQFGKKIGTCIVIYTPFDCSNKTNERLWKRFLLFETVLLHLLENTFDRKRIFANPSLNLILILKYNVFGLTKWRHFWRSV